MRVRSDRDDATSRAKTGGRKRPDVLVVGRCIDVRPDTRHLSCRNRGARAATIPSQSPAGSTGARMGKRAERKAFKKNGVDAAMSVADAEPTSGGGGGGWSYGDQISAMAEDGKDGADVSAAAAKKPSSGGALTAGGVRMRKKTPTVLRGITKRKNKAVAKAIAHADRRANKAKKKTARRGIREEGKGLY